MTPYSISALARHTRLALLASALALAACGGGGDGGDTNSDTPGAGGPSDGAEITTEQAQASARSASEPLSTAWNAVNNVVSNSTAADVAMDATGLSGVSVTVGSDSESAANSVPARHAGEDHSDGDTTTSSDAPSGAAAQSEIDAAFSAFLANPTRDGNTLTYTPDVTVACSDELIAEVMAGAGDAQSPAEVKELCETIVPNITVVQTLESDTTGTLTYRYRDAAPLVVGYAPNSAYFEVQLDDSKAALQAMAADAGQPLAEGDLPTIFEGALRLTATETGTNAGSIRVSVPEAVEVSGAMEFGEASFALATSEKLIEIGGDETAGTAYVESDVGALMASLPDADASGTPHLWEFAMAAFTGRIDVNNSTQQLTVTNLGFGGESTTVRIDGQEALRIALANLGATVDGNASTITLDSVLDFAVNVANPFGMMSDFFADATNPTDPNLAGSFDISAPAGTQMTVLNPDATSPVTKISAGGPLELQGTGEFAGSVSLPVDSCFTEDASGAMPLAPAACPQ